MTSDNFNDAISERLKSERKRLRLTQTDAAQMCDVSSRTLLRWEKGTPIPSDKLLILHENNFDVQYIITGFRPK